VTFAYTLKLTDYGNPIRWRGNKVALRVDPKLERAMGTEVRSAAVMASEAWRGFSDVPDVTIEDGAPPEYNANRRGNAIYYLEKWPFESNQLAVTLVTYRQTGEVIGVDVLVNGSKSFKLYSEGEQPQQAEQYDLAAVLTHEIGHVLGLGESYDHPEATMWPQIRTGEFTQRTLADDDQDGVIAAYAVPIADSEFGCSVGRGASSQNSAVFAPIALAGMLMLWSRRRARA
jgi:MYXO-CTERM domain-containing protein